MSQLSQSRNYERAYVATRLEAQSWSTLRLTVMLKLMISKPDKSEANWGAFDAIADLMGKIDPLIPGRLLN